LCEEVRISTDELAKSTAIWYPKYEAAACIVSELSFKLEQIDEKIRGIYCDENLLQHMAQFSKSKVQGLKDMVSSLVLAQCQPQLQNIVEQVENENLARCQVTYILVAYIHATTLFFTIFFPTFEILPLIITATC